METSDSSDSDSVELMTRWVFSFQLRRFNFHYIISLYASHYQSDYDSVASENKPLMISCLATREVGRQLSQQQLLYFWLKQCLQIVTKCS